MTYSCSQNDWFRQPLKCWTSHSYSLTFLHYRYWRLKARRFTIWRISLKAKMDQWQPCWFLNAVITIKMTGIVWVHLSLTGTSTENMLSFQVTKGCAFLTKKLAKKSINWNLFLILPPDCYCCSFAKSYPTLCDPIDCNTPGFTVSQTLLRFVSIELMLSNHLILCHHLLFLPSVFRSIRDFPMSRLFLLGGQSTGASATASALPMYIQGWFPLGLTSLISLQSKGLSRVFSSTTI